MKTLQILLDTLLKSISANKDRHSWKMNLSSLLQAANADTLVDS